ncbi:hypothetical protein IFM89_010880 [Coptis chinensis]|uniref:Uncharacterized protein n=1 Tax=Coptis chinensis TaxID=261450 RepID=A0A835I2D5_9MAGN|nr:hypothetical protein IFM89_010880 [Coptis chinensis]
MAPLKVLSMVKGIALRRYPTPTCSAVQALAHQSTVQSEWFFFMIGEPLQSNLSCLVVAMWLCVVLTAVPSNTAILTSMFTVSQLKPSVVDLELLIRTNAAVGCNANSFIVREIVAAFFVTLPAKVFLARCCDGYSTAGRTYKIGGFGFVFPKGSPLIGF